MSDHNVEISLTIPDDAIADVQAMSTATWELPSGITIGALIKMSSREIELALLRYYTKQWVAERVDNPRADYVTIEHRFAQDGERVISAAVVSADPQDAILFKLSHS